MWNVAALVLDVFRFSLATRRIGVMLLVLAGLVAVALAVSAQVTAPLVLYPFA